MIKINENNKKECTGCYACLNICPKNCISMEIDNEGFWYPKVDEKKCIKCNLCNSICNSINKKTSNDYDTRAYACINKDEKVRLKSSSGGIFTLIAEKIIENNGVVFGVGFNDNLEVVHSHKESKGELYKYRGSKYVQSKIGNEYTNVKRFLESGRSVLFSGTPCQIGGLKAYLGKPYENLFLIDIVCHGVPSPKVFKEYISYQEEIYGTSIKEIFFREKKAGWRKFSLKCIFENNKCYEEFFYKDHYMKAFLKDICLRPSCYECKFKTLERKSDLTLADFWGIENVLPVMDDNKGTSLILINSKKAEYIFNALSKSMEIKPVEIKDSIKFNPPAIRSAKYNKNRRHFFSELESKHFDELVKKYCKDKNKFNITSNIKRILSIIKNKLILKMVLSK